VKAADVSASMDTAALRALLDKSTPGRWIAGAARKDGTAQVYCPHMGPMRVIVPVAETEPHNAALIAALRNAAPALLDAADERDRLRAEVARLRDPGLGGMPHIDLPNRSPLRAQRDALKAEMARLREALTCILRCTDDQQAEEYARSALAPTKEKP